MNAKQVSTPITVDSLGSPVGHAQADAARSSSLDPPSLLYPRREARSGLCLESATALAASMSGAQPAHQAAESESWRRSTTAEKDRVLTPRTGFFPIHGPNSRDRTASETNLADPQPSDATLHNHGYSSTRWIPYSSGLVDSGRPDAVLPYSQLVRVLLA